MKKFMNLYVRLAQEKDLKTYINFLQPTFETAYPYPEIGLTKECFSKENFASENSQQYFKSKLILNDNKKTWFVFDSKKLVGSITVYDNGRCCELSGFYVRKKYQGKGIGRGLFEIALKFAKGKEITLDVFVHNKRAIDIYKKWGFEIDNEKAHFYRRWPEWPEGVKVESIYMKLAKSTRRESVDFEVTSYFNWIGL
jgi:ribosomal protein S18 acetylase RimI-like enzyme